MKQTEDAKPDIKRLVDIGRVFHKRRPEVKNKERNREKCIDAGNQVLELNPGNNRTINADKVEVQSQLSSASLQSLDNASRTGRKIKYAAINVNTNRNDKIVALSSLASILVAALMIRAIGPLLSFVPFVAICRLPPNTRHGSRIINIKKG
jgi:hypothetical protein